MAPAWHPQLFVPSRSFLQWSIFPVTCNISGLATEKVTAPKGGIVDVSFESPWPLNFRALTLPHQGGDHRTWYRQSVRSVRSVWLPNEKLYVPMKAHLSRAALHLTSICRGVRMKNIFELLNKYIVGPKQKEMDVDTISWRNWLFMTFLSSGDNNMKRPTIST